MLYMQYLCSNGVICNRKMSFGTAGQRMARMRSCDIDCGSGAGWVSWRMSAAKPLKSDEVGVKDCLWWVQVCPVACCPSLTQMPPSHCQRHVQPFRSVCRSHVAGLAGAAHPPDQCRAQGPSNHRLVEHLAETCCTHWKDLVYAYSITFK